MKKISGTFFILALTFGAAHAKTVYVTDNLNLSLRSQESNDAKVVKLLPTGTPLTVISENNKTGFSRVRLSNGMEGYILTRNTIKEPAARDQIEETTKNMRMLESENARLKAELTVLKESVTPGTTLEQSLANERDHLNRELSELKKTSTNAIQIKNERDELQERVVNVERDLEQFKLENQALKDTANQDWFLYGGILSLAGVILGFILPKLGWRRKNNWGSF
ncbi:MAG: TIGR04211 family SH3 domain-containing protein [Methylococcaceae bacterium]